MDSSTVKWLSRLMAAASVTSWLETHGTLIDKKRKLVTPPHIRVNKLQEQVAQAMRICSERRIPCRLIGLKARQVGLSTISIAAAYHQCRLRPTSFLLIGDEYEKSVKNLLDMFNRFAKHDQAEWGNAYHQPSGKFTNDSQIVTETANDPRAGASGTYQIVVATEVAHWKETKQISATKAFQAFMACVPVEPDTLVVLESTANGEGNAYHETYMGAISLADLIANKIPQGWNGFVKLFYAWHEHPEYRTKNLDPHEQVSIMAALSKTEQELVERFRCNAGQIHWRRRKIAGPEFRGNESKFEEEYPKDEASAFLAAANRVFSQRHVKEMEAKAAGNPCKFGRLNPHQSPSGSRYVSFDECPEMEAWLKVWEDPEIGQRYIVCVDPMTGATRGVNPDNHGIMVLRLGYYDPLGKWHPTKVVARAADCGEEAAEFAKTNRRIACCRWAIDIMQEYVKRLSEYYGAIVAPEVNADRGQVQWWIKEGIPVISQQKYNERELKEETYYGWWTDTENRAPMIEEITRLVRYHNTSGDGIEIFDPVILAEMKTFIRLSTGRTEAMGNWHDDTILGLAVGYACRQQAYVLREERVNRRSHIDLVIEQQRINREAMAHTQMSMLHPETAQALSGLR